MKPYWDSSALVGSLTHAALQLRLQRERGFTRPHALAETFSALTANPQARIDANDAAEFLAALKAARKKGVRGGRVHDYLHAVAAEKCGATKILTLGKNDCENITALPVEQA